MRRAGETGPLRARLRRVLPNLILLGVSSGLAAGAAELLLRRYFPEGGLIYRLHPRYLHTLAPGTRKLFRHDPANGGGRALVTVNSRGFRGDELRTDPGLRVVV
jgi:hypothetical protein